MLFGLCFEDLNLDQAADRIIELARSGDARQVATVNVDFLTNALGWFPKSIRHPELYRNLAQADLLTADGMPLVLLSKFTDAPLSQRVTGADLVPEVARRAADAGLSIYLLGGSGETAENAARVLKQRFPKLIICGCASPVVHTAGPQLADSIEHDQAIVDAVNKSGARILFTAFGNPKQELWFNRNQSRLHIGVAVGIGGTFSFIDGSVRRAPTWIQRSGLEWVYRIAQEPGRLWRRYACGGLKFLVLATCFCLGQLGCRKEKPRDLWEAGELLLPGVDSLTRVNVSGSGWARLVELNLAVHKHILLDATACTSLRGDEATYLLDFVRACRRCSVRLHVRVGAKLQQAILRDYYSHELSPIIVSDLSTYLSQCYGAHVAIDTFSEAKIIGELDAAAVQWISDSGFLVNADRLDLSECLFIDSTGMGWLVGQKRLCRSKQKGLVLTAMSPTVRRSLRVANLENFFTSDKVESADLASLQVFRQTA
jgi:exopolysaccharide biosynthesis WecB/TagA/CpsF family protein/anti-anti-sigma factor